ncbi:MAG: undecaprenyldiphospho-muramoylpentapeptide beta-N-acetylglucosaminyltransferase [Candidatus Omnitrophica bacterium]|nr:undecaprenyldiphospho-muramoylpentapeptide beta-N-acetylglucosaminyltransferase [Candidatus Omnitrophota bacterium]
MKILIVAGGTGGHIFPAVALANKIRDMSPNIEISFCVDKRVNTGMLDKSNYSYSALEAPRMPYGISFKWIPFLIKLMFSFSNPGRILDSLDPDVVVGFGAYISGPILVEAKKRRKKIFIHEQNVVPGRANQLLLKIADKAAFGFENNRCLRDKKCVVTGNPIRSGLLEDMAALDRERACRLLELSVTQKTALVMGGSLGSRRINELFLNMLRHTSKAALDCLQIIHLTSTDDFDNVQSAYNNIKVSAKVYPFFERMGLLYKAADFAVCRAGAITISELCAFGVPAILIPYTGAGAHQSKNAQHLEARGAAMVINEERLDGIDILKKAVLSLLEDKNKLLSLSENIKKLAQIEAAESLAKLILDNV